MRVFVTGASGHIGALVVRELLEAGHQVIGLARSDKSAAALSAAGAEAHRGALDDLDSLRRGAEAADGVIHLAYIHDFSSYANAAQVDKRAIETLGEALAGSGRPFVVTSGCAPQPMGRVGTEDDTPAPGSPRFSEVAAQAFTERGVRVSAVRLAPSVHGPADVHGFVPHMISIAREKGVSAYVGAEENRWPAVHELDAARLFRLALEGAPAGSRLHGVGDEGLPMRQIAEVIAHQLNLPAVSLSPEDASAHFGWFAAMVTLNNPASNALTRRRFGWQPTHPGLIADLESGFYFDRQGA